ncbi:hypothetical protein AAP_01038 [Ascosphaera apis ARSEF 7405]|uniref:Uncharacterized protein n=1 Tax=Ascosphaera apis ARSEF 7405 TaxID=392613 RepID=A0A168C811_9EURO|nr:hypothetical protein AAP_01038 [Ascosphaera apis ARSEF 7405]
MLSLNSNNEYRDRVYVALYGPSDPLCKKSPESFQWAFHVSPKTAPHGSFQTARYQLKKRVSLKSDGTEKIHWNSEQEFGLDAGPDDLVVEVQIGGIKATRYEFEECLREDPTFNDRVWMQQALLNMARENVLTKTSILSWEVIEKTVINYYVEQLEQGTRGTASMPFDLMPFAIAT